MNDILFSSISRISPYSGDLGRIFPNQHQKILYGFFDNYNSVHTRKKLRFDLDLFSSFIIEFFPKLTLLDIDHDHVTAYKNYLDRMLSKRNSQKRYTKESVNRKLTSLSCFYFYLGRRGLVRNNPLEFVKRHQWDKENKTDDLSDKEAATILDVIDTTSLTGKMHLSIIMVFLNTGMRHSELRFLKRKSFYYYNNVWVLKFSTKNEKERLAPLSSKCAKTLTRYIVEREKVFEELRSEDYLFCSTIRKQNSFSEEKTKNNSALSANSIIKIVQKYVKMAGIKRKITPHSFRSTAIGSLLESGQDLGMVSEWIGHTNVNTTKRYSKRKTSLDKSPGLNLEYLK